MAKQKQKEFNYEKYAFILIALSFLIRVIIALVTKEGGDPAWHLNIARFIGQNFKIPIFWLLGRDFFSSPPLFHIFGGLLYNLFGLFGENVAEIGLKIVSPLMGSGVLIFTYLIAKELTNKRIAFFSTLFMAVFPLSIYMSVTGHTEMTNAFFICGAVYFLIKKMDVLTGIFAGLGLLSKISSFVLIPLIAGYFFIKRNERNRKKFNYKRILIIFLIIIVIASPFYIFVYKTFGNPLFPMTNSLGIWNLKYNLDVRPEAEPSLTNFLDFFRELPNFYLASYGVPEGRISNLNFIKSDILKNIVYLWFLGTILFTIPLFFSNKEKIKERKIIVLWISLFLLLLAFYLFMEDVIVARYFIPAFPALAIFWGRGMSKLAYSKKYGEIMLVFLLLISLGFISAEVIKANIGAKQWDFYKDDFNWIKENTDENSIVLAGGQSLGYYLERQTVGYYDKKWEKDGKIIIPEDERGESPNPIYPNKLPNWNETDYIFINNEFAIKLDKAVWLPEKSIKNIEESDVFKIAYYNEETGTEIYKKEM